MRKKFMAAILCLSAGALWAENDLAREILQDTGVKGGLIVHLGCGDGKLTAALGADERFLVHGLDADADNVVKAREHIRFLKRYGRVSSAKFDGKQLPYVDNLVNLLVAEKLGDLPMEEVMRALAPLGVAYVNGKKIVKPWPKEIDEWTHWLHAPDNNPVARDTVVDIPRNLQWVQSPNWISSHNLNPGVSAMVTAKGRLFSIMNEAPAGIGTLEGQWTLTARDAFNGLVLWRRPIRDWGWKHWSETEYSVLMRFINPFQVMRRLVAVGDRVFVTPGFHSPVQALDAATGKELRTYAGTEKTFEILLENGMLLLAVNHAIGTDNLLPNVSVLALNPDTGVTRWRTDGLRGASWRLTKNYKLANAFMTAGSRKVYLIDRDDVVCLDQQNGRELWRRPRPAKTQRWTDADVQTLGEKGARSANIPTLRADQYLPNNCALLHGAGVVVLSEIKDEPASFKTRTTKIAHVVAMDASTGSILWEFDGVTFAHFTPPDLFITDGLVWVLEGETKSYVGLDLKSGKKKVAHNVESIYWKGASGHHNCYRSKASSKLIFAAMNKFETINFHDGALSRHGWIKGFCGYGVMPANGMIYFPPHNCICNMSIKLTGFRSLTAAPYSKTVAGPQLEPGPAYGDREPETPALDRENDWPMHRHDPERTGTGNASLSARPAVKWRTQLTGRLSQVIAASGRVYLAGKDTHSIYCLNQETGEAIWQFTAGGRIDSAPTYSKGRIVFGSRDGHVYCLAAKTGALIWKFRAAPYDVQLVDHGQLESAWPMHGSLLVQNEKVYALAGRSAHLNGGMHLYALDLESGKARNKFWLKPDLESDLEREDAVLPDLMVAAGDSIHLRNMQFDANSLLPISSKGFGNSLRATSGFLDESWFNTSFWQAGSVRAQSLVRTQTDIYGVSAQSNFGKSYQHDVFKPAGKGCRLFRRPLSAPAAKETTERWKKQGAKDRWSVQIPLRAQSLLVSGERLYVAGARDRIDPADPWGHIEGRFGGLLVVYDTADGRKISELPTHSAPIFDGLSASDDNLFLVDIAGIVTCYR